MIIFYGTKGFQKVLGHSETQYQCSQCGHTNHFEIIRNRRFFTLFFIPLIPIGTKFYLHCPSCNSYFNLEKQEAEQMLVAQQSNQNAIPNTQQQNLPNDFEHVNQPENQERQ